MSKFCPNCNAEMPEEANFCLNCMTPCDNKGEQISATEDTNKCDKRLISSSFSVSKLKSNMSALKLKLLENKKKTATGIAAACAVLVIALGSVGMANNSSSQQVLNPEGSQSEEATENEDNKLTSFVKNIFGISDDDSNSQDNSKDNDKSGNAQNSSIGQDSNKINGSVSDSGSSSNNQTANSTGNSTNINSTSNKDNSNSFQSGGLLESTGSSSNDAEPEVTAPAANSDNFEFKANSSGSKYYVTKYIGKEKSVTIPAQYNGKPVSEISSNAFKDSNVEYVYFESNENQSSVYFNSNSFNNCQNLKSITFPGCSLSISSSFVNNCPNLSALSGIKNSGSYKYDNGCLYYNNGSAYFLRFVCPGANISTLTLPSWCHGIESSANLKDNSHIKIINMNSSCTSFPDAYMKIASLQEINVESGNSHAYSKNGVLFIKTSNGSYRLAYYPIKNSIKTFTVPGNVNFDVYSGSPTNSHLETLYIPKSATVNGKERIAEKRAFTNLKTIYIESGSQYEDYFKENFSGTVKTY